MDVASFHIPVLPEYVYLHYPLCRHTCSYCDFNVYTASKYEGFSELWLEGIERDLRKFAAHSAAPQSNLRSLYLGGGTPSLLTAHEIEKLLKTLENFYPQKSPDFEFTIECNPETLTAEKIQDFRSLGINRLSLGVQSFQVTELKRLERLATVPHLMKSLDWIVRDFKNFSLDLMLATPDQTQESLLQNISEALSWRPPHVSLYLLTLSDDHAWKKNSFMKEKLGSDEKAEDFYFAALDVLKKNGFEHYEISNFSRPGFRSRHNSNYWDIHSSYLGLGPGAHGYLPGASRQRYEMIRDPMRWFESSERIGTFENLSPAQTQLEGFYLKLRTRKPIQFTRSLTIVLALESEGLVRFSSDGILLTDRGWLLMESVAERLMQCMEES